MNSEDFIAPVKRNLKVKTTKVETRVSFCVTPQELKKIKRIAAKNARSVSNYIRHTVINSMKLT